MEYIFGAIAIVILVISVVLHEYAHGRVSYAFGDTTPRDEGRLTLNPIKHLDPVGSVFLPLFLVVLNTGFVVGWAKPIPINPNNYKNKRIGWISTSLAGPLTNYLLALVSGALILGFNGLLVTSDVGMVAKAILWYFLAINFILGSFNLIPLPPLDGFWVILNVFPEKVRDSIAGVVYSRYYPVFIIITAIVAVSLSKYTVLPLIRYIGLCLGTIPS